MRPALGTSVSAPSSSLLRFLRQQNEETRFFTSNSSTHSRLARTSPQRLTRHQPASARHLTTTPCHQATLESNIFNLDFLRLAAAKAPPKAPISRVDRCGTPVSHAKGGPRYVSTDSGQWRTWWAHKSKKERSWKPGDLPPLPSFWDDVGNGAGRSKMGKTGNELRLRCTEIDENGNVTTVNGEFKKSELMDKVVCSICIDRSQKCLWSNIVRSSSTRSPQNRFVTAPTYPCTPIGNTNQSPTSANPNQI